jgi:N-methylhydantoinase A
MQSNGGSISTKIASKEGIRSIYSGPAGGVVGAYEMGKQIGITKLITFDMGGTSTDVSLIHHKLGFRTETIISGYSVKVPSLDIHSVGAGGGSIAYLDKGGALRVGPESAGADPGPVCYGKGDKITITDANLFLGRLVANYFLGGKMKLQTKSVYWHLKKFSNQLKMTSYKLAEGILEIANTTMARAIRLITVERGFDPADFTLFSFGGAGGMHAVFLAKMLNIKRVLIPRNPGILSAMGMLMANVIKDYSLTIMKGENDISRNQLVKLFESLKKRGRMDLIKEGIKNKEQIFEFYLDMRYEGQSYELIIPFVQDYIKEFHKVHHKTYGYHYSDRNVEIVNLRLRCIGKTKKPRFSPSKKTFKKISKKAYLGKCETVFNGKIFKTQIIDRKHLFSGNKIKGPAIIVEYSSTTVLPPYADSEVDCLKNLMIKLR